jgi:hypothetical protein
MAQTAVSVRAPLSSTEVFEWAERAYPNLFPGQQTTQSFAPFRFRYYSATETYLALDGTSIQALAPWTNGQVRTLGRVTDFACQIDPTRCSTGSAEPRTWQTPHRVDEGNGEVTEVVAALDDTGRATIVVRKQESDRATLFARQGSAGTGPEPTQWGAWTSIDVGPNGPISSFALPFNRNLLLATSPSGHAVVAWIHRAACKSTTYLQFGTCDYVYTSRKLVGETRWEAPILVTDTPGHLHAIRINDRGDTLLRVDGWVRSGSSFYSERNGVAWRARASTGFTVQLLTPISFDRGWQVALDNEGRFVAAGEVTQDGTTDLAVYRGIVGGTIGPQEVIDQRAASVTFRALAVGTQGGSVVVWDQNNGTRTTRWAAVSEAGGAPYTVTDFGQGPAAGLSETAWVAFSDHGVVHAYDLGRNEIRRWAEGVWSSAQKLPGDFGPTDGRTSSVERALNRNGDMLSIRVGSRTSAGTWSLFDASRHLVIRRFAETQPADFVIGLSHANRELGQGPMALASNTQALVLFSNRYDVMPRPGMPAGDARTVISRVWASILR